MNEFKWNSVGEEEEEGEASRRIVGKCFGIRIVPSTAEVYF